MAKKKKTISQAMIKTNRPSLLMVLEPRILYDGAGVAVAMGDQARNQLPAGPDRA